MLRIVFMGSPDFAVPTLSAILGAGHDVAAVYCQPARPAGRGKQPRATPVEAFARAEGLEVRSPESLRGEDAAARFASHGADVAVVVAYGLILPPAILDAPPHGCLNLHASLLPRWRGAAPIQRAIMAGDSETGIAVMRMEAGLDTGPVCLVERLAIGPDMTAGALHDEMAGLGGDLMVRALAALARDSLDCTAQSADGVTYAEKIAKAETRIDWSRDADAVHNHVRGLSPFPGAWFEIAGNGAAERIKVLRTAICDGAGVPGEVLGGRLAVACGTGAVQLLEVQRSGRKPMAGEEFLRGRTLTPGTRLA